VERSGSLYDYAYYSAYKQRVAFFQATMAAYNDAVDLYNSGSGSISVSKLQQWNKNVELLGQDLGEGFLLPDTKVVSHSMFYWN